ncbi:MAG TPA: endonuclease/exonuclease/phosphatase family protein [Ktedonobacteraceae bacterium]|nr:endonuclease/exonuclease/phosphatase family protein [Ktedonobacteraceae bacterium]
MTRILSYNILAGGYNLRAGGARRTDKIVAMIRSVQPDVVGLIEAIHPKMTQKPLVAEDIAEQLDMRLIPLNRPQHSHDYQTALLTRLPVVDIQFHSRPGILTKPLLEVSVEETNGQQLTVFVTHLSAAFSKGWAGNNIRRREVREILRIMATKEGKPHLLMGDFNSLAPGDHFQASALLGYIVQLDRTRQKYVHDGDGNPHLDFVVPQNLRFFNPLLRRIPGNRPLTALFDTAAALYAPRGSIRLLLDAGYQDCFRQMNPGVQTFTCPSAAPAGRIDYIFASPELAGRLASSTILTCADGVRGDEASDHLPVFAEFGLGSAIEKLDTHEQAVEAL